MIVPTYVGWNEPFFIGRLKFVTTCPSTPEQYDVFSGDEKVGYVRLRCGRFSVHCPDYEGESVLERELDSEDYFETQTDREDWLTSATDAIRNWIRLNRSKLNA